MRYSFGNMGLSGHFLQAGVKCTSLAKEERSRCGNYFCKLWGQLRKV